MGRKILQSEKGMSLIEVVITSAIALIVMVGMGNALMSLYRNQATISKRDIGNEFAASFSRNIHSTSVCTTKLTGVILPPGGAATPFTITDYLTHKSALAASTGDPTLDDLAPGVEIENGLSLVSLTISNSNLADMDVRYQNTNYKGRMAVVELTMGITDKTGQRNLKPRRFNVPVLVNPADDSIVRCHTEIDMEDACVAMGGTYDSARDECIPGSNCFLRGTYMTSVCNPASTGCPPAVVNSITSNTTCPNSPPVMARQTGESTGSFVESCGKKCSRTINYTLQYFICMECN